MLSTLLSLPRRLAYLAFAALIVLLPFRFRFLLAARPIGAIYGDFTDFLIFAADLALIASLSFWALDLRLSGRPVRFGPWFITVPLALLSVMGALSALTSVDPSLTLYHTIRLALLFGLYLYVVNEIRSPLDLAPPVAAQIVFQAVVAVGQVLEQHSLGLQALGEYNLDPAWNGISIVWAEGTRSLRGYGLSDHPNILGGCLAFALMLLAAWHVQTDSRWRTLSGTIWALGALALLLTFSRAAWLALGGGLLASCLLLLRMRQAKALWEAGALIGAAGLVVLPFAWHSAPVLGVRINQNASFANVDDEVRSFYERGILNAAANELFVAHPLLGVGLGTFPVALQQAYPLLTVTYQPVHVSLLEAAVETGIGGALGYAFLLGAPWVMLWWKRRNLTWSPALVGTSGLLLAITLVGLFDYYPWLLVPGRLWQWLAWGLWAVAFQSALSDKQHV